MRRTLETVAAERLNKLGKDNTVISDREDLKTDQEALKNIIIKSTPMPSRSISSNNSEPNMRSFDPSIMDLHLASRELKAKFDKMKTSSSENVNINSDGDNTSNNKKKSKFRTKAKNNIKLRFPLYMRKSSSIPSKLADKINDNQ
jgi:hypothetical protein